VNVLVTGATGFIGWHTAARLREAGHRVVVLARDRARAERILTPLGIADEDIVVGDMTDETAVARALDGCEAVVHAAAAVSVTRPGASDAFEDNIAGTHRVIGGACERGCHTVVFVSSLTAIFDHRRDTTADSPLIASATRYGRSKAHSDAFVRELQERGQPVAIVYPSGVIGPDDPGFSESVRAYRNFLKGTLRTGGTSFVDARDLARLLEGIVSEKRHGRLVANGHYFSWDDLTKRIEQATGAVVPRLGIPAPLMRGIGRTLDVASRITGRTFPFSGEGIEIATRWRPIADSPEIGEMGIHWRPAEETLEDLFRWLLAAGRLPAKAVPRLAEGLAPPDAR
jgi:nucleoside-diphosphate-sugar epimerase